MVITPGSRILAGLLQTIEERASGTKPARVFLVGAPTGSVLEVFSGRGARVTVDGEEPPKIPLTQPDAAFDIVLGLDVIDFVDDGELSGLASEWARVLAPGGRVYLLSRSERSPIARRLRAEAREDGGIVLEPLPRATAHAVRRPNRELYALFPPLVVDQFVLRRDGMREILLQT